MVIEKKILTILLWKAVFSNSVTKQWLLQWHTWSPLLVVAGGWPAEEPSKPALIPETQSLQ